MVQASAHAFSLDASALQRAENFVREFGRASVGVLNFVVVWWKPVVVVDQTLRRRSVDFDGVAVSLPVGGENYDGFWFYLMRDFVADGLQFGVGWVSVVFEEVWAS